uniref:Bornyl diphosphate synthase n=1 Tax=Phyla dulcis TaxID=542674 RepID=A0A2H4RGI6_PHYDL|nr:bornyl diphosphate synthase [Phyla dulcis]
MAAFNIIMRFALPTNYKPKYSLCGFVPNKTTKVTCSSVHSNAKTSDEVIKPGDEVSRGRRSGNYEPPIWNFNYVQSSSSQYTAGRRSGNYEANMWDFDYIQSSSSQFTEDRYLERASELVVQVKKLLEEELTEPIQQLELIDDLQNMGVSYHFEDEIKQILKSMYDDRVKKYNSKDSKNVRDLYSTALEFRLSRQHGFTISQEVFDCFKNNKGGFEASLAEDTRGLLQLYEASFMLMEGEETLEQAKEFATSFLLKKLEDDTKHGILVDENLSLSVFHALELPIHWRTQRHNARWFIDAYEKRSNRNSVVLELAKVDFNIVQATYQQEIKHISRWWEQTRLAEKLPFARDRLVENFLWTVGWLREPQYGYARIMCTKLFIFITYVDDIFDVYGTLEELQLFRDVIRRWDIEAMGQLPNYMQMCFLAIDNFINEMAYDVLKEQEFVIIPHLRKMWADLCTSYCQEAEWYYNKYMPTMDEYINNACISISTPLILSNTYFVVTNPIEEEVVQNFYKNPDVVRYSAMILRLADDLGTSEFEAERGDVPKAIECYMNESGASREEAREHVKFMIWEAWKKINKELLSNASFPQFFLRNAADLGRAGQFMYQHGDGFGVNPHHHKEDVSTLFFEPL